MAKKQTIQGRSSLKRPPRKFETLPPTFLDHHQGRSVNFKGIRMEEEF